MWRLVQRKFSWMLTATSGYIIGPHGLIYDLFMTTQHVIWLQSWINALWTLKTVYFLIYSYFFFASERCRRKTIRKGRTKWWCSPIDTSTRCIAIKIIRLPNFGAKRLHTESGRPLQFSTFRWSLTCTLHSAAKWKMIRRLRPQRWSGSTNGITCMTDETIFCGHPRFYGLASPLGTDHASMGVDLLLFP